MNTLQQTLYVIKRNGQTEEVSFDKVIRRIKKLCINQNYDPIINPLLIAQKVCSQIYDNVSTCELDELAAQICISMITVHLDYGKLASRIIISNNQKNTSPSFSEVIQNMFENKVAFRVDLSKADRRPLNLSQIVGKILRLLFTHQRTQETISCFHITQAPLYDRL